MIDKPFGNSPLPRLFGSWYAGLVGLRNAGYDKFPSLARHAPFPVISVGGIHAGGTGKTPLTILIGRMAAEKGLTVAVASRGYRRRSRDIIVVPPGEPSSWEDVGDEPFLMRDRIPGAWLAIGADRARAIADLSRTMPTPAVALLDDGFQHRRVARDLDIVCLPPDPFSGYPIPAGLLREPLSSLRRAHAACLIGSPGQDALLNQSAASLEKQFPGLLVCALQQIPGPWVRLSTGEQTRQLPVSRPFMMCGIARPERFELMVNALGVEISGKRFYEDHHIYSSSGIEADCAKSAQSIVTTEKDAVKLKRLKLVPEFDIWYLTIELAFCAPSNQSDFRSLIHKTITP